MTTGASLINFHYSSGNFYFPNRTGLKKFIAAYLRRQGRSIETVNIIFCTDKEILRVNRQFLNHDFYTDIITFELSEKNQALLADIFISTDRVRENSKAFQTSFNNELHRVIFHGFLHLLGFRDKTNKSTAEMRNKEAELLGLYFKK
jgi:probable rRNA maturation factor